MSAAPFASSSEAAQRTFEASKKLLTHSLRLVPDSDAERQFVGHTNLGLAVQLEAAGSAGTEQLVQSVHHHRHALAYAVRCGCIVRESIACANLSAISGTLGDEQTAAACAARHSELADELGDDESRVRLACRQRQYSSALALAEASRMPESTVAAVAAATGVERGRRAYAEWVGDNSSCVTALDPRSL